MVGGGRESEEGRAAAGAYLNNGSAASGLRTSGPFLLCRREGFHGMETWRIGGAGCLPYARGPWEGIEGYSEAEDQCVGEGMAMSVWRGDRGGTQPSARLCTIHQYMYTHNVGIVG